MNAIEFFLAYEKFITDINFIVQTVKQNNSATQFTNAQKSAVITAAGTAIDELNDMREEVYAFTGFSVSFPSYDDTAPGNTRIGVPIYADVNSLRVSLIELLVKDRGDVIENQGMRIADSYANTPTYTKTSQYLTSEAAAIVAMQSLKTGLSV